ncbi:MAG: AsmA-like C-terminal region-containing protein [Cyclobacteriaceae bacterium]
MRLLKKILFYLGLSVVVLILAFGGSLILFKDKIIQQFIREANKNLGTPVQIGRIDISAWQDFPNLAITFIDVYVEDSHEGLYPLLTAKKISFYLNTFDAWSGKYSVRGLQIEDSETHLKIDSEGKNNFTIVKNQGENNESIKFDLRNVKLTNTLISYQDMQLLQRHSFASDKLTASINVENDIYRIETNGDLEIGQIGIRDLHLLEKKNFDVNTVVNYDDVNKNIVVEKSKLELGKSEFELEGNYNFKTKDNINVTVTGKNTNLQTMLSLLPENLTERVKEYQSKGEVYFSLALKGEVSETKSPLLSMSFGCKEASFSHPTYKSRIENANLEGSFASPSLTNFSRAELFLKKFSGMLNGKPFEANLSIQNFDDPYVSLDFKGSADASSIQNFYPIKAIKNFEGGINADIQFDGKLSLLKDKATAQQVRADGTIELKDISFTTEKQKAEFKNWNGTLQFNKNDIAMSNVTGHLEKSDLLLNGFLKNVITFLLFENQPIGIEADLKSDFLDLDRLMSLGLGESSSQNFGFIISPNLHMNFNCDVKSMKYKNFTPRKIKGDLLVKNQVAISKRLTFNAMGGSLSASGIVDAKNPKAIDVSSSFKLEGIDVDSVFYVFDNFYQDFIVSKNLKGEANADVTLEMKLDEKLKLFSETLTADISALIKNGELNDFEPLQKLNKYLDDGALNHLRFADLKNDIHIEKKTIFIPQMEVHTNATNITLSGTHTFDQQIDYRVIAPLRNKKKIDPDEAFGAIEETGGQSKIFLKIIGTTDNYEVKFDKEATKKKIVSDLKKEVKELKEAFQNRGIKKKKEVELQKDEYFDWDNPK